MNHLAVSERWSASRPPVRSAMRCAISGTALTVIAFVFGPSAVGWGVAFPYGVIPTVTVAIWGAALAAAVIGIALIVAAWIKSSGLIGKVLPVCGVLVGIGAIVSSVGLKLLIG